MRAEKEGLIFVGGTLVHNKSYTSDMLCYGETPAETSNGRQNFVGMWLNHRESFLQNKMRLDVEVMQILQQKILLLVE